MCWNFVVLTRDGKTALWPSPNLVMTEKDSFWCETKATSLVKFTYDIDTFLHGEINQNIQTGIAIFLQI